MSGYQKLHPLLYSPCKNWGSEPQRLSLARVLLMICVQILSNYKLFHFITLEPCVTPLENVCSLLFVLNPTCFYFLIINQLVSKQNMIKNCFTAMSSCFCLVLNVIMWIRFCYNTQQQAWFSVEVWRVAVTTVLVLVTFDLALQKVSAPALQQQKKKKTSRLWQTNQIFSWVRERETSAKSHKHSTTSITEGSSPHHNTALCGIQDPIWIINQTKQTATRRGGALQLSRVNRQIRPSEQVLTFSIIWLTVTAPANVKLTDCNLMLVYG